LTPDEVTALLGDLPCPWWLAGGWSIDLHLGRQTRSHEDTDVVILRDDQGVVRDHLAGWDLRAADPPGSLRPWPAGEVLPESVHDVWCRRRPGDNWALQLMIVDVVDGSWVYRRDPRIRRPLAELDGPASGPARRVLAPEVQLLYKSKAPRAKDEADFAAVVGELDPARRDWLGAALTVTSARHPWLPPLTGRPPDEVP
jgi:hypothetical protein